MRKCHGKKAAANGTQPLDCVSGWLDVDNLSACGSHARCWFPGMTVDDLKGGGQAPGLAHRFVAQFNLLQGMLSGQSPAAAHRDIMRTEYLELAHQAAYIGISKRHIFHIHDRV